MTVAMLDSAPASHADDAVGADYFPAGLRGWLHPDEGRKLEELAAGKTVLEIGSFVGLSALCMARTARKVHTVDWHRGDTDTKKYVADDWTLPELAANLGRHDTNGKIVVHAGHVNDVLAVMQPGSFDMAFIDGAHDVDSVCRDVNHAIRLVKRDGILAFHDTQFGTVVSVLAHLYPDEEPLGRAQSLAWFPNPQARLPLPTARVYLAVPAYGPMPPQTVSSLYSAVRGNSPVVADWTLRLEGGSLLALAFNRHWCLAMNQRASRGWTHFAMHHGDIEAAAGWLDVLVEEMERTGADILSVVNCIKDERGLTSTGIQNRKTGGVRRLTMKEIHALPETFDAGTAGAKEGECLAVNTGLMLIDLRKPWVDEFPGFTITDHLSRTTEGKLVPLGMPEDWAMSLWAAEHGLKVLATRKVATAHYGGYGYRNDRVWGEWDVERGDTLNIE